ncbi:hypothetical protein BJA5080_06715 [Bradyrhizobium diazoefficiens SEMIA 5080]|uniref:Uncharacterized protein n=1 Tax=Bradyrhizobium diazoefficiens SEMIA 5080 TaxID=754504 RepID=A0A837CMT7_9BRAD|nr:hypothetical protein BJA5080_06715 [Bradyrhizobium diazoefficiens SEMIA 5080]
MTRLRQGTAGACGPGTPKLQRRRQAGAPSIEKPRRTGSPPGDGTANRENGARTSRNDKAAALACPEAALSGSAVTPRPDQQYMKRECRQYPGLRERGRRRTRQDQISR